MDCLPTVKQVDRIFHCEPPKGNIPRYIFINKYHANLIYKGQKVVSPWKQNITYNKCFEKGHKLAECTNEWKCKSCGKSGHKSDQCEEEFESEEAQNTEADSWREAVNAQINEESLPQSDKVISTANDKEDEEQQSQSILQSQKNQTKDATQSTQQTK